MHITHLGLRQFRNFTLTDLELAPGLNVFLGPNGAGKSNILEAISIVCQGASHRGAEARHWIQEGKDESALTAKLEGEEPLQCDIRQKRGRMRQVKINNRAQTRLRDWLGRAPIVTFSPDDLELVKGEPSGRRRAVNEALSQADPAQADLLARYQRVVEERNSALRQVREGQIKASALEPWDLALMKEGAALTLARKVFLDDFTGRVKDRQAALSGARDKLTALYRPSFHIPSDDPEEVQEANRRRLMELREGEIALGSSLVGPHRDDVEFRLGDEPAKARMSQGQARTLALAWKWEEKVYLKSRLGREPIYLLDDVFSELDPARRKELTELLCESGQGIVSLTDLDVWGESERGGAKIFEVNQGAATVAA